MATLARYARVSLRLWAVVHTLGQAVSAADAGFVVPDQPVRHRPDLLIPQVHITVSNCGSSGLTA